MAYVMFLIMIAILCGRLFGRIETGFYDAVMMRGATKFTFWLPAYFNEVLGLLLPLPALLITQACFGIVCPGIWFPWMQFAFTEPLFLFAWTYFFLILGKGPKWII